MLLLDSNPNKRQFHHQENGASFPSIQLYEKIIKIDSAINSLFP